MTFAIQADLRVGFFFWAMTSGPQAHLPTETATAGKAKLRDMRHRSHVK